MRKSKKPIGTIVPGGEPKITITKKRSIDMCGLVGFMTEENTLGTVDRAKFLRQALIIDTLRGEDSTGLMLVTHDSGIGDSADWIKAVGDGYSFVNDDMYAERTKNMSNIRFAVGHNRAATQGAVTAHNAHPFQEGAITMVHNGTLRDDTPMPKSMDDLAVVVDSHAICHNLALQPNTYEGVNAVVSKLDGAFALIWHDSRDDTLNIVRNDERPLHFMQARFSKTIYFASEAEMLALLAKRLKIEVYEEAHYPSAGQYMKFKAGSILTPETHTLDLYVDDWQSKYEEYGYQRSWQHQLPPLKKVYHKEGTYIPRSEWDALVSVGCYHCKTIPLVADAHLLEWEAGKGNDFLCDHCNTQGLDGIAI